MIGGVVGPESDEDETPIVEASKINGNEEVDKLEGNLASESSCKQKQNSRSQGGE